MAEPLIHQIAASEREKIRALPSCPTCKAMLLPSGHCSRLGCPEYIYAVDGSSRDLDLMMLRELYRSVEVLALSLEGTAAELRRRSVFPMMGVDNRGRFDVTSYSSESINSIRSMIGNLGFDRVLRAAADFDKVIVEALAKEGE